jgi:hypothetical protein
MNKTQVVFFMLIFVMVGSFVYVVPRYYQLNKEHKQLQAAYDSLGAIVVLEPRIDTFYNDTTVYVQTNIVVRDSFYIPDTFFVDVCKYLRNYRDSIPGDDLTLYYDLQTRGTLVGLDIWYNLHSPTTIIQYVPIHQQLPCITPKISIYGNSYIMTDFKNDNRFFLGASLYYDKYGFSYSISPQPFSHLFGLYLKIPIN